MKAPAFVPFVLTGQVSWGVETVCSADMAMAYVLYDFIVEESAGQSTEPVVKDNIEDLFEFVSNGNLADDFENLRNEANNGVTNGWQDFSDVKNLIPNSNGVARWQSALWNINVSGQKLTSTGLEQGFVTATYAPTGSLLRFSFSENGEIVVDMKVGGTYVRKYTTRKIDSPKRYGVTNFVNGDAIDTELVALAAAVDRYCEAASRG